MGEPLFLVSYKLAAEPCGVAGVEAHCHLGASIDERSRGHVVESARHVQHLHVHERLRVHLERHSELLVTQELSVGPFVGGVGGGTRVLLVARVACPVVLLRLQRACDGLICSRLLPT